jgi:opacity protein-like surface antigen
MEDGGFTGSEMDQPKTNRNYNMEGGRMGCSKLAQLFGELLLLAFVLTILPARSKAEPFADLGLGVAVTQDEEVKDLATGGKMNAQFNTSFSISARGGYWFDGLPWLGVAGSVSYYQPDVKDKSCEGEECEKDDLTVIPLSVLLMARAPLMTSSEYPNGQLQPYIGLGPGLFICDLSPPKENGVQVDTAMEIGLDARLGVAYAFTPRWGLFGEYAFEYTAPRFTFKSEENPSYDTELATHRFLLGARYTF